MLAALVPGARRPITSRVIGPRTTVADARVEYVRWLRVTRDLSPHTLRAYDGDLQALERHVGLRTRVGELDRERLVEFIEAQQAAGLSATSLRRRASGLRGFCRWLVLRRLLDADPFAGTTVAAGRARKLPRVVAAHDLARLLRGLRRAAGLASSPPTATVVALRFHETTTLLGVALMIATGVRVHEAVGVRCADLDLAGRRVRILGKGRRERQVFLPDDWLVALVEAYLHHRARFDLGHDHLLLNRDLAPLTPAAMRARVAKAARDCGLSARVTPHMLRHTAATQLIEAGVDIRYIQRLLGHASLSTTEIYTHVSDHVLQQKVTQAGVLGKSLHA